MATQNSTEIAASMVAVLLTCRLEIQDLEQPARHRSSRLINAAFSLITGRK
jgi:hypothetical protein